MNFYKYQTINLNSLSALKQEKIWYSSPKSFNDPFEFRLRKNSTARSLQNLRKDNAHLVGMSDVEVTKLVCDKYETEFNNFAVACFTLCEKNIIMWGHYAEKHYGMCLRFSLNDDQTLNDIGLYPVQYDTIYPEIDLDNIWHKDGLAKIMFTKSSSWNYEKELRIIRFDAPNGVLHTYPAKLTGIIFGCRTPEDKISLVQEILKKRKIEFFKVQLADNKYKLDIKSI